MAQYGYGGGRANPYDQREGNSAPYPHQYGGGQQYGNAPAMGRDEYGNNVELEPLTPNGGQFSGANKDPKRALLDECAGLDRDIDEVQREVSAIQQLQGSLLSNPDPSASTARLDNETANMMQAYRGLVDRIKRLKGKPEAGNPTIAPQIRRVNKKLQDSLQGFRSVDADFRKKMQEQIARQFRIVRPDATEEEVRAVVENSAGDTQMFSQALMQSNRRGQAQSALSAVQSRHEEIQKIERQMIELAELFQDMENLVVQQEVAVTNIEMKGEEVVVNMDKGNEQLTSGIKSARNARKWKWWCLGICVLIVIIIAAVVAVVVTNNTKNNKPAAKRSLFSTVNHRVVSGQPWSPTTPERSVEVPGLKLTRDNNLAVLTQGRPVQPGVEWTPPSKKERRFQA